jgi:hypothetical protein
MVFEWTVPNYPRITPFKEVVNGKLQAIDFEIAKLMDRPR